MSSQIPVSRNGQAEMEIVIPENAVPIVRFAAEEIRQRLKEASGADIPILNTPSGREKTVLYLGDQESVRKAGIQVADLPRDGFMLKTAGRNDIVFLLIGDGAERENLQRRAETEKLDNVIFTGRLPKKEIPDWIASSDVNLVHLKKNDLFRTVMPSKIFESAGCAKPILIGVEGFACDLVLQAEAGIAMEPENAAEMVEKLTEMAASPELCEKLGKNAFNNIAAKYDRDRQAAEYAEILRRIARQ